MGTQRVVMDGVPPSLNTIYAGRHWSERKRIAQDWHAIVWHACRSQGIQPPATPVRLTFTCRFPKGSRRFDCSNILVKVVEDGLVRANILPGDSPQYVEQITVRSEWGTRKETEIIIEGI